MAPRIAVIGTGFIGTSIGLGLKKARIPYEIVGHDKDPGAASKAKQMGAVDKTDWNLIGAVDGAGLIILALPLHAIKPTLEAIAPHLPEGAVVSDTANTKLEVLAWADSILPHSVHFVSGHPLVTRPGQGTAAATSDLFVGASYCLIPAAWAGPQSVELLVNMVGTLGALPYFLDAAEHDSFVAAVAHLPLLMAAGLMNAAAASASQREIRKVSGAEFSQATALAAGDAAASAQICAANQESLLHWMDSYIQEMQRLRGLVATGGPELQAAFEKAAQSRLRWLRPPDDKEAAATQAGATSAGEQMRQFLLGDLGRKRGK